MCATQQLRLPSLAWEAVLKLAGLRGQVLLQSGDRAVTGMLSPFLVQYPPLAWEAVLKLAGLRGQVLLQSGEP